jgi:hypothetical protein
MNSLLRRLLFSYMAPEAAAAAAGGAAAAQVVDRGDNHVATEDDKDGDDKGAEKDSGSDKGKAGAAKAGEDGEDDAETEEERAEREKEEKAAAEHKRIRIPKARVDEMIAKERAKAEALQKELDKALSAVAKKETSADVQVIQKRIDQLEDEIEGFRADGKKTELQVARKEMRELQDVLMEHKINERAGQAKEMAKTELKYDALVEQIEKDFPELNPESDDYDEAKASEVLELRDGFAKNGVNAYDALKRAMKYVMGDKKVAATSAKADDRAEKAREKAVSAAKAQPQNLKNVGFDSDKAGGGAGEAKNVLKMDQKEFAKLTDEQRKAMRGDEV